jgi:hypothetical protein
MTRKVYIVHRIAKFIKELFLLRNIKVTDVIALSMMYDSGQAFHFVNGNLIYSRVFVVLLAGLDIKYNS